MKLRIKTILERTLEVSEESYGTKEAVDMLKMEKDQFEETLQLILNDPETKLTNTITVLDDNGFPIAETHWEEGPEDS